MKSNKLYQVSTLQALALGYTKPVVTAKEMIKTKISVSVRLNMLTAR